MRTRSAHTSIQVRRRHPAFPAQWLYGLFRALLGERLSCHRRRRDTALDLTGSMRNRRLSASTAAPGPHDFAVRNRSHSSVVPIAATASHRAFRDDREPPLLPGGTAHEWT